MGVVWEDCLFLVWLPLGFAFGHWILVAFHQWEAEQSVYHPDKEKMKTKACMANNFTAYPTLMVGRAISKVVQF